MFIQNLCANDDSKIISIYINGPVNETVEYSEEKDFPDECPVYDTKHSNDETAVMMELWEMSSTPLLPSFPGRFWSGVVLPDRVLSMGQIELNCTYTKLNCLQ